MNAAEALAFEADPMKNLYIKIRLWDDLGKETGVSVTEDEMINMKHRITNYLIEMHQVKQ